MPKSLLLFILTLAFTSASFAQGLNANFDSGIPAGWTQNSNGLLNWTTSSDLGVNGTGCAIVIDPSSESGNTWLQTPFINLTTLTNPKIDFSTAIVKNNFMPPNISLWYDNGGGWVFLANWGVPFSTDVMFNILGTDDYTPPLDASNVSWVNLSFDVSSLASNSNIRFSFGADVVNGGWALLDNVTISGITTDIQEPTVKEMEMNLYPNPTNDILNIAFNENKIAEKIVIYNFLGQEVKHLSNSNMDLLLEVDISELAAGNYYISAETANSVFTRKFNKID